MIDVVRCRWSMPPWPGGGWTTREARLVVVRDGSGTALGVGEAAPLLGRSGETLAACDAALARAARERWPMLPPRALASAVEEVCAGAPSAAWAVWSALCDARARARGVSAAALMAARPSARLPIAAVIEGPAAARAACERGVRTLKLKLAPPVGDAIAAVIAVRASVGAGVTLRVDGNRQFRASEVAALLDGLAPLGVELVEEPAPGLPLDAPSAPPLALDESLAEGRGLAWLDGVLAARAAVALVLKPTVLGPATTFALAARARAAGLAAIVSHALEGPVGIAAAAELALALGDASGMATGLDAHPGLGAWKVAIPALGPASIDDVTRAGTGLEIARVIERAHRLA